jgi:hypothetical protein
MRHLWSLLAGVVAAPLTWVLVSMGQGGSTRTVTGWLESRRYDTVDLIEPAAYLAVAGIVLGLIGTLRFSPLGPLVAGLLLIGPYAGMFADPFTVRDAVPGDWEVLGDPLPLRLPLDNGTLLLLGVLLVMATFSVQRWRRWPQLSSDQAPSPPSSDEPPSSGSALSGSALSESALAGESASPRVVEPVTVAAQVNAPAARTAPADAPAAGAAKAGAAVAGAPGAGAAVAGAPSDEAARRPVESPWSAPPPRPAGSQSASPAES